MNEKSREQCEDQQPMHALPKGVIDAGIAAAEDAANTANVQNTVNPNVLVPVSQNQEKSPSNRVEKIKRIGKEALSRLLYGNSITWSDTSGDSQDKGE